MAKILLFNPLPDDFTVSYDSHGKTPQKYTAYAEKITEFDEGIGEHIRKHLITAILNKRGIAHYEHNRQEVKNEITKTL